MKDLVDRNISEKGPLPVSSGENIRTAENIEEITTRIAAALNEEEPEPKAETGLSTVFRELAIPKLPQLRRENRARLQMQTPNRVYFYWSLKNNPFQILHRAFGENTGSYTLVLKLINTTRDSEEIHPVDAEGNWWFNVDPDSAYRAEIGFYAPNRPYFRALYSNTITTPRKNPSPRTATDADWRIPAQKFAQVLNVSGFKQDAFDVAIAGDNEENAKAASFAAFARLTGRPVDDFTGFDADDIRYALTLLAAGATLEDLRFRVSERLFAVLQSVIGNITREKALGALQSEFEIDESEPPMVIGGSVTESLPNSLTMTRRRRVRDTERPTSPVR